MIDLRGSRFTDIMPENLASQLETQAFAYALGRQIEKLCTYADGVHIYAAVASIPEKILDILAVELQTPAYRDSFTIEVKRALIEGTLTFYAHLGTPAACNRIIEIIFGAGYIEEWYTYDGDPHHFRACVGTSGGEITPEELEEFRRVLESVKRLSSWMDDVITLSIFNPDTVFFIGQMGRGYMTTPLPEIKKVYPLDDTVCIGGAFETVAITILPEVQKVYSLDTTVCISGAFEAVAITDLPEIEKDYKLGAAAHVGGIFGTVTTTAIQAAE